MSTITLKELHALADKYRVIKSGTKCQIADTLCSLRGYYLSNTEREKILPFCKNNKNKSIMIHNMKHNYRRKMPKK